MKRHILLLLLILLTSAMRMMAQNENFYVETFDAQKHFHYYQTDYVANNNTKVTMDVVFNKFDESQPQTVNGIFDATNGATSNNSMFYAGAKKVDGKWRPCAATANSEFYIPDVEIKQGQLYRFIVKTGNIVVKEYKDGQWTALGSTSAAANYSYTTAKPLRIGGSAYGSTNDVSIYGCVIEENSMVKHHLIPASNNGYYSLYDYATGTYLSFTDDNGNKYIGNGNIQPTDCQHKFVTLSNDGQYAQCHICEVYAKQTNLWANFHRNDYGITIIEPYINVDKLGSDGKPLQTIIITAANKMQDVCIVDSASNTVLYRSTGGNDITKQIDIPNSDTLRTLFICTHTKASETLNGSTDSMNVYSVISQLQKPFHQPHDVTVTQVPGTQEDGTQSPYNKITWYIADPALITNPSEASDILSSDMFLIYRAFKSDYSDEQILNGASVSVSSYTKGSDGNGYYTIKDETKEGQYNPYKTTGENVKSQELEELLANTSLTPIEQKTIEEFYENQTPIYYRVTRALSNQLWGDEAQDYNIKKTLMLHNMLPPVSAITVEKTSNWSNDKKVLLHISMKNPYVWELNNLIDEEKVKALIPESMRYRRYIWDTNANITVKRFSPEDEYDTTERPAVDAAAETITISGADVKWNAETGCYEATVEDFQALPYTHFYYTAELETSNSIYPSTGTIIPIKTTEQEANECYSKTVAAVGNFTATRGTVNGSVNLEWQLGLSSTSVGGSTLQITRREYKGYDTTTGKVTYGEETIFPLANNSTAYEDKTALPGHAYEYVITSTFTYRGYPYTSEATSIGWPSHIGYISGKVLLPNGTAVKGAKVHIRSVNAIEIPDVRDENGNIIMEGVHTGLITDAKQGFNDLKQEAANSKQGSANAKQSLVSDGNAVTDDTNGGDVVKYRYTYDKELITDENGAYEDSVDFHSDGTMYTVTVEYGTSSFTYNGNATAELTLSHSKWEYTNVNMISSVAYKFSGNVLYENSTIPVRNAKFELIHYDSNNNVTQREFLRDQDGNLIVTDQMGSFSVSLLPMDISLRVVKEGHTMKDDGYVKVNGTETRFTPQKGQDAIRLWDQTKVRMIGRIVGGNIQGKKPLGEGKSRNNLGDNLTVILQLEGDNTSEIVYLPEDPDNTTINKTIIHPVNDAQGKPIGYKTKVSYQHKRIVINPDSLTGEFFVDLAPAKYKVTQLSAQGYATLYQSNEGFDVLDYVDSIGTTHYNRIYHKPATVTYTQYTQGRATKYLGEQKLSKKNLLNVQTDMVVAEDTTYTSTSQSGQVTKKTAACYTFKYPVFKSGSNYLIQVSAHEDYFYNNNSQSGNVDIVNLEGGTLHVFNGMLEDNSDKTYALNENGQVNITISADTPDFTGTGAESLRDVNMQVEYNDYFYNATPLQGYVLGDKYMGADIMPIGEKVNVMDVIHDPYGSGSYAYREKGTTYHWEFDSQEQSEYRMETSIGGGWGFKEAFGIGVSTIIDIQATATVSLKIPWSASATKNMSKYEMTLDEKISTSSDPNDVGAMADVYIGNVDTYSAVEQQSVTVIDQATYDITKGSIEHGNGVLIAEGTAHDGSKFYLVRGMTIGIGKAVTSTFAYSQKHILNTIIPDLKKKYWDMVSTGTKESVQEMVKQDQQIHYWYNPETQSAEMIEPEGSSEDAVNMADYIRNAIYSWQNVIAENEKCKLEQINKTPYKTYSLADTQIEYSEAASGYSQEFEWKPETEFKIDLSLAGGGEPSDNRQNSEGKSEERAVGFKAGGVVFNLSLTPSTHETTSTEKREYYKMNSAGYGFVLKGNDNGYMNMDVYRSTASEMIENQAAEKVTKGIDESSGNAPVTAAVVDTSGIHNFIFVLRGGATRQPWYAADSTKCYNTGSPLGVNTLKIDNPKIYIATPNISNKPEDESATFKIRLTNETEVTANVAAYNPSSFYLALDESTNPNGLQLYMDGAAIGSGRQIYLSPGQSVEKVLEVKKGIGYDFNNVKLRFYDAAMSLEDDACLSVGYLPMATKVNITSPTDNWVMNTFSAHDSKGYYIPITLDGFDVNSDGFHHIELQYKKHTEGDSQWTTFCSFYDNDSIYNAATGVKNKISNGKICYEFYGEKDPMEMRYDLRAVSFRQLGTGFTTRTSSVMSGMKDTRHPEVYGVPAPASGIITYEDDIQLNFTEPIAYNYLNKISNFQVQGYTNNSNIALSSSLYFPGTADQEAITSVNRNLNQSSFTIDMMAQTTEKGKRMVLFSHGSEANNMAFGITEDNRLFSRISGKKAESVQLDGVNLAAALTHVGMIYHNESGTVDFFVGGSIIKNESCEVVDGGYTADGLISLGRDIDDQSQLSTFHGNMLEVRLWGKELSNEEVSAFNGKRLSGYESELVAHWPMTETTGTRIKDDCHGGNIDISGGITWNNFKGYSLKTENVVAELNPELLTVSADADNTLEFWFKVDELTGDHAALFTAGNADLAAVGAKRLFVGFDAGKMVVVSNDKTYEVAKTNDVVNEQKLWHHFAMTVNRSQNEFCLYLDGELMNETVADDVDGVASDYCALGDANIKARFDILARWNQAVPKYIIQSTYNTLFSGKEMGLKAYVPFNTYNNSDQNMLYVDTCSFNNTYSQDEEGNWKQSKTLMLLGGIKMFDSTDAQGMGFDNSESAPVRETPIKENLDFSWSSTGTSLQIDINRPDKDINKQNVFITVRGIEDEYGNEMQSPQMLTFFVNKNILKWTRSTIDVDAEEGATGYFSTTWQNVSGKSTSFTISGLPSWLHADYTEGTIDANSSKSISFTSDAGLAAGSYDAVIYLTDDDGLSDPLAISFLVIAPESGWEVDRTKYDRTMNMRAIVKTKNCNGNYVLDSDPEDKVGAFIANACIGVANIKSDGNLYMTIYGDEKIASDKRNIQFRLWDHETGEISELLYMPTESTYGDIQFTTNATVGLPPSTAVTLASSEKKVQSIRLTTGWNWASFNVAPSATEGVNSIFINQKGMFSDGDIIKHVDFAQYDEKTLDWLGNLASTDYHNVYQIYVAKAGIYRIMGKELSDDDLKVTVNKGWNDCPYLLSESTTIDNAFADFLINDKAKTGDIIKSMTQFAVADGSSGKMKWVGTLEYMQPGVGYYLYHTGDATEFKYQRNTIGVTSSAKAEGSNLSKSAFSAECSSLSGSAFSAENMPVIATLADAAETMQGDTIIAIADSKVVGVAPVDSTMFISVNAVNGNAVTFGLCRGGEVISTTSKPVTYNGDAIVGSLAKPYVIDFNGDSDSTATNGNGDAYDLAGRKVNSNAKQPKGIYIVDGQKVVKDK